MIEYKDGRLNPDEIFFSKSNLLSMMLISLVVTIGCGYLVVISVLGIFVGAPIMLCLLFLTMFSVLSVKGWQATKNCFDRAYIKYEITKHGLVLKYPLEKVKVLPWYTFRDICICYPAHTPPKEIVRGGIKMIILARPEATKSWYFHRWAAINPLHFRDTLAFDYTQELHDTLSTHCYSSIVDRRMDKEYKL